MGTQKVLVFSIFCFAVLVFLVIWWEPNTNILIDRRYIFPAGAEDLEQYWLESNISRLKLILAEIPTKLADANFSEGQKMVMLEHNHPNSIHLAIKDAVDHKGAGLYDFMVRLVDIES